MSFPNLPSSRWLLLLSSLVLVSLLSLVGMLSLVFGRKRLDAALPYLVSLAAGALLGAAGAHLLPEAFHELDSSRVSGLLLGGLAGFFVLEKTMHIVAHRWPAFDADHHHATCDGEDKTTSLDRDGLRFNLLFGGAVHSFVDGAAIAVSYVASPSAGIATTVAVLLHEVPHHIGDVGILVFGGVSPKRAVLLKLFATSASLFGAVIVFLPGSQGRGVAAHLLPIAAASFIYLALANLIPELRKEESVKRSVGQLFAFAAGIALLYGLNFLSD